MNMSGGRATSANTTKMDYPRLLVAMLTLSIPFVIAVILLHGLRDHISTFHGSDEEIFHYPTILRFIETFPRMELWNYQSATTPLFHIIFATLGKIISPALPFLRGVNAAISYACGLMLFFVFRYQGVDFWTSVLIALALVLSPYVFGISFLLLTDNLANLFAIAAILCLLIYIRERDWTVLAFAALFACCAVLTRQLYVWLFVLILASSFIGVRSAPPRSVFGAFALVSLASTPLVLLFILWGGLTPPNFAMQ
jgi:hypothetical protein